jgi:endonuclease YncB( thermonuclease family)
MISRTFCCASLAAISLAVAMPAQAQTVSGPAQALDGDTLALAGFEVDLAGIDAVELGQMCWNDSESWACGEQAREKLEQFVSGKQVRCESLRNDSAGRDMASCFAGSLDLSQAMAESGFVIVRDPSREVLVAGSNRARQFGFGIWGWSFDDPSEWRAVNAELFAEQANTDADEVFEPVVYRDAVGRCAIKGNHSRRGDWIYYLPGQEYYFETRPEAWFCTEEEAVQNGYRASRAG